MWSLFLVCYKLKEPPNDYALIKLAQFMMGPFTHCELVFVNDVFSHAMYVHANAPQGEVQYRKKNFVAKPEYTHHWFKFIKLSAEQVCKVRSHVEIVVRLKRFRLDGSRLASSVLPDEFSYASKFVFESAFRSKQPGDSSTTTGLVAVRGVNCAEVCSNVLRESEAAPSEFGDLPSKTSITNLISVLLRKKAIQSQDTPFDRANPSRVRDKANIKRSAFYFQEEVQDEDEED
jgi:hypothetical protein